MVRHVYVTGMVRYKPLLCHTSMYNGGTYYLPITHFLTSHALYTLHYVMSSFYMRYIHHVICVFNVRASSWTAKAAHSRKAEAPSYRGCPSPLRSFGAAPLTTTKLQIKAKLRDRCSDLLAGQTTIKLRRTTLTCLIIIVFDRIAIFAKSVRV